MPGSLMKTRSSAIVAPSDRRNTGKLLWRGFETAVASLARPGSGSGRGHGRGRGRGRGLRESHQLRIQSMKMMDAVLALHGIAPAVVRRRGEASLHGFADLDVFDLDLVAEGNRVFDLLARGVGVFEVPIEQGRGAAGA